MSRRNINQWGGLLSDAENLEMRQSLEANFDDIYGVSERSYATDLLAANGGVAYGDLYHTDGTVKVMRSRIPRAATGALAIAGNAPVVTRS